MTTRPLSVIDVQDALGNVKQVNNALGLIKDLFWQSRNEIDFDDEEIGDLLHLIHSRLEEILEQAQQDLS